MLRPNDIETKILKVFFSTAGVHLGLYNRGTKEINKTHALFEVNLKSLRTLMAKGIDTTKLESRCRECLNNKVKHSNIYNVAPDLLDTANTKSLTRELLSKYTPKIHRALKHTQLPIMLQNEDGSETPIGDLKTPTISEKTSFTLENLIAWFCKASKIPYTQKYAKGSSGAFNFMLSKYDLNTLLFAIDIAFNEYETRISNPLGLERFIQEAEDEVSKRKAR